MEKLQTIAENQAQRNMDFIWACVNQSYHSDYTPQNLKECEARINELIQLIPSDNQSQKEKIYEFLVQVQAKNRFHGFQLRWQNIEFDQFIEQKLRFMDWC